MYASKHLFLESEEEKAVPGNPDEKLLLTLDIAFRS
jgi:hypothetical protein